MYEPLLDPIVIGITVQRIGRGRRSQGMGDEMFIPSKRWIRSILNRSGSDAFCLQMNSYGVRPFKALGLRPKS